MTTIRKGAWYRVKLDGDGGSFLVKARTLKQNSGTTSGSAWVLDVWVGGGFARTPREVDAEHLASVAELSERPHL